MNLPNGQVLYARLWTEVDGSWRYKDSTFGGTALRAIMNYPRDGLANANLTWPTQWTSVAHAQAYYLYIGSSRGAKT